MITNDFDTYDDAKVKNAIEVEDEAEVIDSVASIIERSTDIWSGLPANSRPKRFNRGTRKAIYHSVCQQTKSLALRINGFVCTARAAEQRVRLAKSDVFRQTFEAMPDVFVPFQLNRQIYYVKCPPTLIDADTFHDLYKIDRDSYTMFYSKELGAELKNKMTPETKSAILLFAHSHFTNRIKLSEALQKVESHKDSTPILQILTKRVDACKQARPSIKRAASAIVQTKSAENLLDTGCQTVPWKQTLQEGTALLEEFLLSRIASKIQINVVIKIGKRSSCHKHVEIIKKVKITDEQTDANSDDDYFVSSNESGCSKCKCNCTKT